MMTEFSCVLAIKNKAETRWTKNFACHIETKENANACWTLGIGLLDQHHYVIILREEFTMPKDYRRQ